MPQHPFLTHELLLSVSKPARYLGNETGVVKKDFSAMAVKVCLCFPDVYEVGMSHLGLRILYDVVNGERDCVAERAFAPWVDMEEKMRGSDVRLFSLESGRPLSDFDILGFSLQYELGCTNVLNMLSLAGLPLFSRERDERHPLVIAGGACCLNPEPMSDFIDAFVVGEGEEALLEIIAVYKQQERSQTKQRRSLLEALARIEGVYVPSLYHVHPQTGARAPVSPAIPSKIQRRYVRDLNRVLDIENWIVPHIDIVHNRLSLEIMRGCPHACRFCQARSSFYPLRILGEEKILEAARRIYKKTGYEEISLLSLSSSDHPALSRIVARLLGEFRDKGVSVALPSLRAKTIVGDLSGMLATARKTSLTFAPEAGSERLRRLINKNIDIDDLFRVSQDAYRAGYRLLKLYFMIGLPTETREDLEAIVDLCVRLSRLRQGAGGHAARLNVSISNFIPKPHTPFQREGMATVEELKEKQGYLKGLFRRAGGPIFVSFHQAEASFLEAVLALGDRRLSRVIFDVFMDGGKFDAWNDFLDVSRWERALEINGLKPREYLQPKDPNADLAWDFIDMRFPEGLLEKEAKAVPGSP